MNFFKGFMIGHICGLSALIGVYLLWNATQSPDSVLYISAMTLGIIAGVYIAKKIIETQ